MASPEMAAHMVHRGCRIGGPAAASRRYRFVPIRPNPTQRSVENSIQTAQFDRTATRTYSSAKDPLSSRPAHTSQLALGAARRRLVAGGRRRSSGVAPPSVLVQRVVPSCLQSQGHGDSLAAAGTEARQLTLEEILYPPPSWEVEGTPARWNSPKVCPVNLDDFSDEDRSEGGYSPAVDESVSVVSRASMRSQHSVSRRVSFRSPDESDVFIIPARSEWDDEVDEDDD
ncbi:hypothetical protein SETIT_6G201300v2 [Setaria italica]|uniref:Uncharacterized protein n=2 Tax=Setaria italica TaxID=4555 RepID=A0A368RND7_SETIT|nr:hypothetical protein SETIT_6G201300v2 [Setaria italica]